MIFSNTSWISISTGLEVDQEHGEELGNSLLQIGQGQVDELRGNPNKIPPETVGDHLWLNKARPALGLDPWARLKISDEDDGHLAPKKRDIHHVMPSSPVSPLAYWSPHADTAPRLKAMKASLDPPCVI